MLVGPLLAALPSTSARAAEFPPQSGRGTVCLVGVGPGWIGALNRLELDDASAAGEPALRPPLQADVAGAFVQGGNSWRSAVTVPRERPGDRLRLSRPSYPLPQGER